MANQMNLRSRTSVNAGVNLPETVEPESSGSSVSSSQDPGTEDTVGTLDCILERLRARQEGLFGQELRRAERLRRTEDALAEVSNTLERLGEVRELLTQPPVQGTAPVSVMVARNAREEVAEALLVGIAVAGLELPDLRRGRLRRGHRVHPHHHPYNISR